jgi:hypothetical protein
VDGSHRVHILRLGHGRLFAGWEWHYWSDTLHWSLQGKIQFLNKIRIATIYLLHDGKICKSHAYKQVWLSAMTKHNRIVLNATANHTTHKMTSIFGYYNPHIRHFLIF